MPSKFLLAGFEDWLSLKDGTILPNPGRLLVEHAQAQPDLWLQASGQTRLETALLPVPSGGDLVKNFRAFRERLDPILAGLSPQDTALFMGQGSFFQAPVRIETRGKNRFQAGGSVHIPIDEQGPEVISISEKSLSQLGPLLEGRDFVGKFELSEDAGAYYCNAVRYLLESGWFVHLPLFLEGQGKEASALWERNQSFFKQKYPGKQLEDLSFGNTEEQVRLLQAFLRATRRF